jgi:hypothetical protein
METASYYPCEKRFLLLAASDSCLVSLKSLLLDEAHCRRSGKCRWELTLNELLKKADI